MRLIEKVYANTRETLRTADKLMITLIMVIIASIAMIVPAYASNSGEGSKSSNTNLSGGIQANISDFSGLITDSFCDMMASTAGNAEARIELLEKIDSCNGSSITAGDSSMAGLRRVSVSNIGNVLGLQSKVSDKDKTSKILTGGYDTASRRLSLETIRGWYKDNTDKISNSAMTQYILFGSALNQLGLSEYRDARTNSDGARMIIGYIMYICFILAYSAFGIMGSIVEFLNKTNVFGWIHNALSNGGQNGRVLPPDVGNGIGNGLEVVGNTEFFDTIVSIYNNMAGMKWLIFGLLVVLFVASITVFKSKQVGQAATAQIRARNLVLRVVIMCIGIPLVGMVYSTLLGVVNGGITDTKYRVTDFIYTQFLDYENWTVADPSMAFKGIDTMVVRYNTNDQSMKISSMYGQRRDDNGYQHNEGRGESALDAARLVYEINQKTYDFISNNVAYSDSGHVSNIFGATNNSDYRSYTAILDSIKQTSDASDSANSSAAAYQKARDMILGYARSTVVDPDKLNNRIVSGYDRIALELYGKDTKIPDEDYAALQTAIVRIFNNTASTWRLWSYNDSEEYISEAYGDFKIQVKGTPIFPDTNPDNYVTITRGDSGKVYPLMLEVLYPTTYAYGENSIKKTVTVGGQTISRQSLYAEKGDDNAVIISDDGIKYSFLYHGEGMSALALYNFMHSKFSLGAVDIYSPDFTANEGVSVMHYAIVTPYSGIPEIIHLVYTICILFSVGVIGWVFGMSMLLNTIVQMLKAIPLIFKMAIGSLQGFVESLLTVMSIAAELFVTILLYVYSIQVIDFIISVVQAIFNTIVNIFVNVDAETLSVVNSLLSMAIILWGTFELIKWRQAITISIKSVFTHVLNQIFGTSAAMPTGASSGMLKAAALGGAAALTANALADQGTLDDVINDMTQSDIGSSIGDKLKDGDVGGAWNDIKDYASGNYEGDVRGGSEMDREASERGLRAAFDEDGNRLRDEETGELMYEDGDGNKYTASEMQDMPNAWQNLTEDQEASLESLDGQIADTRAKADKAREDGDAAKAAKYDQEAERLSMKRAEADAGYRSGNYAKAKEAGVADYAAYEKSLSDSGRESGSTYMPETVEGAENLPAAPSKDLDKNAQSTYDAARKGDAKALQSMGAEYNAHGLTEDQVSQVDEMIANGASETDVAAAVDGFAQQNFGDGYKDVVSKLNEANGRSGSFTYGSSDNSEGNARTVHVNSQQGANGGLSYGITDNNSNAGTQTINVVEDGQGGVGYTNITAGGGNANTIETIDMGNANLSANAVSYAATYNGAAALIRAGGGMVSNQNIGAGSTSQVTVTEMAAMSSRLQMADKDIKVNVQSYGNNSAQEIGTAMTTAQVQADFNNAASGVKNPTQLAYSPLTVSSEAGQAAGVTTYQRVISNSGSTPSVTLESTGGATGNGAPETIKVDYNSVPGNNATGQTNVNYIGVPPSGSSGSGQQTINVDIGGRNGGQQSGGLSMISRDMLAAYGYKLVSDAVNGDGDSEQHNDNGGRHR